MNRRAFLKMAGIGLLGLITPSSEKERTEMQIGDILVKMANGESLNNTEKQMLRLFGNEVELNNPFIGGLKDGSSSITVKELRAERVSVGREVISGFAAKLKRDEDYAISTATYTYFPWTTVEYNNLPTGMIDLVSDDTKIYIPVTGRYVIGINFAFDPISSGFWRADIVVNRNTSPILASGVDQTNAGFSTINYSEDALLTKGDYVESRIYQNSGGSKNVLGANMYIRLIGVS